MGQIKATGSGLKYTEIQAVITCYNAGQTQANVIAAELGLDEKLVATVLREYGAGHSAQTQSEVAAAMRTRARHERQVLKQIDAETNPYIRRVARNIASTGRLNGRR